MERTNRNDRLLLVALNLFFGILLSASVAIEAWEVHRKVEAYGFDYRQEITVNGEVYATINFRSEVSSTLMMAFLTLLFFVNAVYFRTVETAD